MLELIWDENLQTHLVECKHCGYMTMANFHFEDSINSTIERISVGCPECHHELYIDFLPVQNKKLVGITPVRIIKSEWERIF